MNGTIIKSSGGLYTVLSDGKTYDCKARGIFRHKKEPPLVGDKCTFSADEKLGFVIESITPRKNSLIRPPVANIDKLIISFAPRSPVPSTLYIDKLTCVAKHNGIEPVIVITKADLDREAAQKLEEEYTLSGFRVFITSSMQSDGVDALYDFICQSKNEIIAFAGASGVGKSSILNALFPKLELETGNISEKIERGKHTTRSVSLFELSQLIDGASGFIADTPGFSMLDLINFNFFSIEDLPLTFPEIENIIGKCRWRDCTHTKEDGCAFLSAVERGEIAESRKESYLEIRRELLLKNSWK